MFASKSVAVHLMRGGVGIGVFVLLLGLGALLATGCALPHEKAYAPTDPSKVGTLSQGYGLPAGSRAPDATLRDLKGREVTLGSVRGNRPVALIFYRGGWCPPCNFQIHELATRSAAFTKRGVSLIAVSVDDPEHAVESAKEYGIDFPVLSDPDLAAHKAFHVVDHLGGLATFMIARMGADLEQRSGREHHDVAVPSIFLIDAAGVIRWSHVDTDYGKRPSVPQLLDAIDRCGMLTAPPTAPSFPTSTGMSGRPSL